MATSKTLTPTNVTIQIPAMADAPDQSVNSNCIDKLADAVNTVNSQFGVYVAPSGASIKQLAFNDAICPSNGVKWINLRNCSTSDLPNANAVYGLARVIRRVATVARVELYLDNGMTYIATATDSGSTWTAWVNQSTEYITMSNGTNLNSLTEKKNYMVGNISQMTGAPTGCGTSGFFYVDVNSSYVLQRFFGNLGSAHRFSYDGGSTWTAWGGSVKYIGIGNGASGSFPVIRGSTFFIARQSGGVAMEYLVDLAGSLILIAGTANANITVSINSWQVTIQNAGSVTVGVTIITPVE